MVPRAQGRGNKGGIVSVDDDIKVLEIDRRDGCTTW